ncbi:hypothetical protein [Granulicella arctica]|uniref:hypothetical protein n=1 Tax=Granulicella arctica TaxID=940613 RepID=UPI0021E09BDD|nr:hypothetical protein [Granulicella arctica]
MKRRLLVVAAVTMVCWFAVAGARFYITHRSPYAPPRPANISPDATYIQGPNGRGLWESCAVDPNAVQCVIANVDGVVRQHGPFIPYAGTVPRTQDEIVITQKSGDGWISLANGTYLIPLEHNEASRRYLDFMIGNAKHF